MEFYLHFLERKKNTLVGSQGLLNSFLQTMGAYSSTFALPGLMERFEGENNAMLNTTK